jgi:hypothetical protein
MGQGKLPCAGLPWPLANGSSEATFSHQLSSIIWARVDEEAGKGGMTCEIYCSGAPHFACSLSPALLPLTLALGHEAHHAECSDTAINALKADIQAMGEGEAKTTATKEMEAANR